MHLSHRAFLPWISTVLLVGGQSAAAQQPPTAGSQLLQIPVSPAPPVSKPEMRIDQASPQSTKGGDSTRFEVRALQLAGANSVDAAELVGVSGFVPGNAYTLDGLRALATKMTAHYQSLGYFLAQSYLPAQDISDGLVRFTVVEGQYGQINLQNRSGVSDRVAQAMLAGLGSTDVVTASALERSILMLSDLPGINVKSVLAPGTAIGSTDLLVDITPGQRVSGGIEADNQGNRYTGSNRLGAVVNLNEPLGFGDVVTARFLTSGEGLRYARLSYQAQAGTVNVGLAYTSMAYQLGAEFASTASSGTARIGSVYASYPILRSRKGNLNLQWAFDSKELADRADVGTVGSNSDKTSQVHMVTLRGDFRDSLGDGFSNYMLSWTRGTVNLLNPIVRSLDAVSAQSNGLFDKFNYAFARQQNITRNTVLYVSLYGQSSNKNLDASEKMSLGGAGAVRAYPSGEATGDEGLVIALETRTQIPSLINALPGQWQAVVFVDTGTVTLNKTPWDLTSASNNRRLSGAGLGLNFVSANSWSIKASYAFKLGDGAATSAPDLAGRFWLQASKTF